MHKNLIQIILNYIQLLWWNKLGIAKKYQINLNDFFNANPDATNGLSRGQILKIPIPVFSNYKSGSEKDSIPKKQ